MRFPSSLARLTFSLLVILGIGVAACGPVDEPASKSPVAFSSLVADPQRYAGQHLCAEGVGLSGFEASALGAARVEVDGYPRLSEPVVWLEGAESKSREDCIQTDTQPPMEFCQVVVCGLFEIGGGYGHLGAYAYQLRGPDSPVLPTPAPPAAGPTPVEQGSAALSTPADGTPELSGPGRESPQVEPPPAILEIAGQEQVSGIGSYCWTGPEVSVCADMAGIPTAEEPLVVSSPFAAVFRLVPEERPDTVLLEVIAVTAEDEFQAWPAGSRGWAFKEGERHRLLLVREPSIELALEPGLYVLNLSAWWPTWGDASYGFLVEVAPAQPTLVIDEYPIVASGVDQPGALEYMDRLGSEILARLDGLQVRAAEQRLTGSNAILAPLGYRLEGRNDAEWNTTFYDLYREGEPEPLASGLWHIWPVSVNASGTDFYMAAENAPNASPPYLLISTEGVRAWDDAEQSNWLPPVYVGDALARVTYTGFPEMVVQVDLDGQVVYTSTAEALGAYMPLLSFHGWDAHWVLGLDERLIVDGQDLNESQGYDSSFGFALILGLPFYFFERDDGFRLSYGGQELPNLYDEVMHNLCCEPAAFNVQTLGDAIVFHALWDGTWYLVEAGVYDGEMASTYRYTAPEGWSFRYPAHWSRLDAEAGFVQDPVSGRTVTFSSALTRKAELEAWLESEINRKLEAPEADNTLAEALSIEELDGLTVYRYAILSRAEAAETLLKTVVFFDGQRRYGFASALPPVAEQEFEAILASFQVGGRGGRPSLGSARHPGWLCTGSGCPPASPISQK